MVVWDAGALSPVPRVPLHIILNSGFHRIGLITLDLKCAGARSAGNPHATCDVAGVGNGTTEIPKRARKWKRWIQPRSFLRVTAPALDPTRVLETRLRRLLNGHEGGNAGYSQGVSYGFTRQRSTLPTRPPLLSQAELSNQRVNGTTHFPSWNRP